MKTFSLLLFALFLNTAIAANKTVAVQVSANGFEPSQIEAQSGDSLTLSITRKTESTCARDIKIPSLKMQKELPLNKTVVINLGKVKKGNITFSCGMDMISGVINVK
jgi:plastocyanin domain-containing protein